MMKSELSQNSKGFREILKEKFDEDDIDRISERVTSADISKLILIL